MTATRMPDDVTRWSAARIAAEVGRGARSAEDVTRAFLARVKDVDPRIRAFVAVQQESAIEAARAVDRRPSGSKGRLAGVPVAIKDNILVRGARTTCGSKILEGYTAPYDATVIEKLRDAGAVIIGKTNLDEFAMGSSTENSAWFKTKNPWDLDRVPGGSSGGSAAAVAARLAPLAVGSDTGGSIRQPAAFCGVVGLKPTYGLVSRYGLVAFASSLDQIGPFARTMEDAALCLSVIAGHDSKDSTSAETAVPDYCEQIRRGDVSGLRLGVPKEYFIAGMDPEVEQSTRAAIEAFRAMGASVSEISLPHTRYAVSAYYLIAPAEASANLARFDGMRYGRSAAREGGKLGLLDVYEKTRGEGFGPEVKRRIMLGTYALSSGYYDAYYGKAQRVRTLIQRDFTQAFGSADLIVTPTAPTPAFRIGEKSSDPLQMYLSDIFTIPCNLAGIAGLSIPCGKSSRGLPIGVQLLAKPFEESRLLAAAAALERTRPFPVLEEVPA